MPNRLRLPFGKWFLVYDFATFTSGLDCHKDFLQELSIFCSGEAYTYWDARNGLITRDFGDVMWDYTEHCSAGTQVSYERVTKECRVSTAHVGGLLGVFGNLMTSTVAHGLVVRYLNDNDDEENVAGDDGLTPEDDETSIVVHAALETLGTYERSKTFRSNEEGCIHLKRPLWIVDGLVQTTDIIKFPSSSRLLYLLDKEKFPDYRYTEVEPDDVYVTTRISRAGRELLRLLRSVYLLRHKVNEIEMIKIIRFCLEVTKMFGTSRKGSFTELGHDYFWPRIPDEVSLFNEDPMLVAVREHYNGLATLPEIGSQVYQGDYSFTAGITFQSVATPHITWLKHLGFLETRPVLTTVYGEDGFYRLYDLYRVKDDPIVHMLYNIECVKDIPYHLQLRYIN
jgi:hypothetical protein